MNDSMAQPRASLAGLHVAGWKSAVSWIAAVLLAILFLSSGIWKITDISGWAVKLAQARIPQSLSVPGALIVGIAETLAGVLLLVPRLRRWGVMLSSALLIVFLAYFAINYNTLRGMDCSCFPWLKRPSVRAFSSAMRRCCCSPGWRVYGRNARRDGGRWR